MIFVGKNSSKRRSNTLHAKTSNGIKFQADKVLKSSEN